MWKGQQAARDYGMDSKAFPSLACRSIQTAPRLPGETQPGWSKHRLGWAGWLITRANQRARREGLTNHNLWRVTQLVLVLRRTCTNSAPACSSFVPKYRGGWEGTAVCGGGGCQCHPTASSLSILVSGLAGSLGTGLSLGRYSSIWCICCLHPLIHTNLFHLIYLIYLICYIISISSISSASSRSIILNLNPTLSQPRVWSLSLYFCL